MYTGPMATGTFSFMLRSCGILATTLLLSACGGPAREGTPGERLASGWQSYRLAEYKQALLWFDSIAQDTSASPVC